MPTLPSPPSPHDSESVRSSDESHSGTSSGAPRHDDGATSERVLLLARPPSTDQVWIEHVLRADGIACEAIDDVEGLLGALRAGAGAIVADADAVTPHTVRLLTKAQARRPPWSNLPILVLIDDDLTALRRLDATDLFQAPASSNVTLIERPIHDLTLLTLVRAALRARRRQYEMRDLLGHLEATNEELRASQEELQAVNETLEARVEARTRQVRALALSLTTAEQRERTRLSQILHDHLQPLVHGAKMWTETQRDEPQAAPPDTLDRIVGLLDQALQTSRSLTVDLSPPVLRTDGLAAALAWLAEHVADTHDLRVTLDVDSRLDIPAEDLRTLLFDAVRELLFNVVKHAGTNTATVSAHFASPDVLDDDASAAATTGPDEPSTAVCIVVADAGTGFDPSILQASADLDGGFGLFSVRERIQLIGGRVRVDTAPGAGTRIHLLAPVYDG